GRLVATICTDSAGSVNQDLEHIDPQDAHMYLALALEKHGISNGADDLVVKEITTAAGRTLYVIIAWGGLESALKRFLSPLGLHYTASGPGIWVMSRDEMAMLLKTIKSY